MLGTPHNKAFKYNYFFIDTLGVQCRVEKVICLMPGAPNIHQLILSWNRNTKKGNYYELIGEIPVKEALNIKSTSGSTIRDNWKFLGDLKFHSVEISFNKVLPILA